MAKPKSTESDVIDDISLMTKEELSSYKEAVKTQKDEISEKMNSLEEELKKIKKAEKKIEYQENLKDLEELRANKDLILKFVAPSHTKKSCSDRNPCNDIMGDGGEPFCKRCMLIRILNEDWENDYKLKFDVTFKGIY